MNGTPFSWATSATLFKSTTFNFGLPISSVNTAFVFSLSCERTLSAVTSVTKRVVIPNASKSWNKSIVPPNNPALAMTSSPARKMFRSEIVTAAIPEEHATAPIPFSSEETRRSKESVVGFPILVYAKPGALLLKTASSFSADSWEKALTW